MNNDMMRDYYLFKASPFLVMADAKFIEICGREVMVIPLKDWGYAPVDRLLPVEEDYKEWVLVIEKDGKTWLWDSCIMEG